MKNYRMYFHMEIPLFLSKPINVFPWFSKMDVSLSRILLFILSLPILLDGILKESRYLLCFYFFFLCFNK